MIAWVFAGLVLALIAVWGLALVLLPIVVGLKLFESTRRRK